jgi:hypothetical protein
MGKGRAKGTVTKSSIVIDFMQMRADWEAKVPSRHDREFDCRIHNGSYNTFASRANPSKLYNGCGTVKMDTYIKWIEASGLDINKYVRDDLDPRDYIIRKTPNKEFEANDTVEEPQIEFTSVLSDVLKYEGVVDSIKPEVDESKIVIFEKPGKKYAHKDPKPANKVRTESNVPMGTTKTKSAPHINIDHSTPRKPGYVRTIKKADAPRRNNKSACAKLNKFTLKMQNFLTHLPIYLCALHLTADDVICATSITNFRDIRDGRAPLQLYDYIVLSEYLMTTYNTTNNSDYKEMFDQVAKCFNDIYISTLYYNDSGDDT